MQNFKSFFIVVSHSISGGNYGKSTSLKEALKLSKVNTKSKYVTYVGLVKEDASDEQLKNIGQQTLIIKIINHENEVSTSRT